MSSKELYAIAEEFLIEQGFDFEHCSWHLDSRVHEIPKCVDCDSPGIAFFHNHDDSFISISSVVNVDEFSYRPSGVGKIVVRNEEELKDALIVLISLIKNWHERLIKLEENHEEILEIERRKND